jgi:KaiC/GvpD/RAD55 family RecA-like ATPase
VNGQRMRFLEVIKSRGTHHLPGRSLFFIHDEGVRVVPPYRSPFYRFDQAASTGHSGLDDLLGGGIPDGSFYLIEVSSDIHQRLFEVNFLREALTAGDAIVVIDRAASLPATLVDAAARFGMADALDAAYQSEQVVVVAPEADVPAALKSIRERVQKGTKIRVFLNVTRAATGMNHDDFLRDLQIFADALRESGAIAMATLDRDVFNLQAVERIRSVADGIISVWREGSYNYLQVLKTVNSARTPVSAFLEVAEPPFIELLQY